MRVSVEKLTDVKLLRRANSSTTGHESNMTLATAYIYGHSPIRTQLFWVECKEIPLFVASQLVRSHVGVQFYQRSKRTDRGGADFTERCKRIAEMANEIGINGGEHDRRLAASIREEILELPNEFDRLAPTDLSFIINAEALMNMAHKRLCTKASPETRKLMQMIKHEISIIDPDLAKHLVPMCIYRNRLCGEPKPCGYWRSESGKIELAEYADTFRGKRYTIWAGGECIDGWVYNNLEAALKHAYLYAEEELKNPYPRCFQIYQGLNLVRDVFPFEIDLKKE